MQTGETLHISYDVHFSRHGLSIQQAMQTHADLIFRETEATKDHPEKPIENPNEQRR